MDRRTVGQLLYLSIRERGVRTAVPILSIRREDNSRTFRNERACRKYVGWLIDGWFVICSIAVPVTRS